MKDYNYFYAQSVLYKFNQNLSRLLIHEIETSSGTSKVVKQRELFATNLHVLNMLH